MEYISMIKNILEIYLRRLNEKQGSSINKQIRVGNLSPEAIDKLKKAGLIKSKDEYVRRIN